ncbi:cellulase family glycosylhydrolase [Solirubrobacter sp. CPCC 204708]|nr:cellulase family glycosylhydrolase [Solirubrobacter deserti]
MNARALRNSTLLLLIAAPSAHAMQIGFYDPAFAAPDRAVWLDRARDAGSTVVRMDVNWSLVAPHRPANATDPNDPAYRWATVDGAVNDATARGQRVILTIWGAPPWAEQGQRPATAPLGVWMPNVAALKEFATAAGLRYAGRVRAWQIWNEPNLSQHLQPQWRNGKMFAPVRYRQMLTAAYDALKAVDPGNLIVTAGTGPYGDPRPGADRIMPVRFWRAVMCLDGERLRPRKCGAKASFDVLAHHPYGTRGPRSRARNEDDVAIPDLAKLKRVERAAARAKTVRPATRKPLWVTEVSWDSSPPDPDGVPAQQHAQWLIEAMNVLERQHVEVVTWFRLRDQPPVPSFAATNQSGLYLVTGEPKPALAAFMSVRDRLSGGA